jgi:guanylate kinase
MRQGILFIVSAPSGTGKTTLVERLVPQVPALVMSRSYTSRPARPEETDGVDYNFVSRARFDEMVAAGAFLEWATIFGHAYGTGVEDTARLREAGTDVVLVIDVQGAETVRSRGLDNVGIFVLPPSFQALERRLRGRSESHATESELRLRLNTARREVDACTDYDYVVVNDEIEPSVDRLRCIVVAERARRDAARESTAEIVATFRTE